MSRRSPVQVLQRRRRANPETASRVRHFAFESRQRPHTRDPLPRSRGIREVRDEQPIFGIETVTRNCVTNVLMDQ